MVQLKLPCFVFGKVVKGFGRGSKELGIPTANYSEDVVNELSESIETGIFMGWAKVDNGPVHKMVMSVGWNPFYKNKEKTMEVHILHAFDEDFYGSQLKVCILRYIRPEMDFKSVDELVSKIKEDISVANSELDKPEYSRFRNDQFFNSPNDT